MNPRIKSSLILAILICLTAAAKTSDIERIRQTGALTVGVKDDVPGFGFFNQTTNEYEGLEIDIARAIAKQIFDSESKITFVPVNERNRSSFLNQNRVDMIIATFSVTDERRRLYDFSDVYYTDALGLMVRKSSGIASLKDLENKRVGVTQGTISSSIIRTAAGRDGVLINIVPYPSNRSMRDALLSGDIDALAVDHSILSALADDSLAILPERYGQMMYAVAIKKDSAAVTKQVNDAIRSLVKSGRFGQMLEKNGLSK